MKRWCEGFVEVKVDAVKTEKVPCRFQDMILQNSEVKGVPDIEAYVCPNCGKARWLPLSSLGPFLTGLQGTKC